MGDIFGLFFVIEVFVVFFLEFIFMGIWLFGKDKILLKFCVFCMWMVVFGINIFVFWIIIVNGFM